MKAMFPNLLSAVYVLAVAQISCSRGAETDFPWFDIEPTPDLQYHACYDGFKCARLKVPMDWLDPNNTKSVALAIITIPATVPEDDPSFGGTIITNPGGPGGSGVSFIQRIGKVVQDALDGNKHYEILSFDPRGVAYTTPSVNCVRDAFARDAMVLERRAIGRPDVSPDALGRQYAMSKAFGGLCEKTAQDDDILAHVSTASVARDMVEIVDRLDELRKKSLLNKIPSDATIQRPLSPEKQGVARIQYYGFSYGTMLGNVFASMFPGRVGRLVVDGVVDAYDYMKGSWLCNLHDTDKVLDYFYETCFKAGKRCPLVHDGDQKWTDTKQRVDKFISDADAQPVAFVGENELTVISGNDILTTFRDALYRPLPKFEEQAATIAEALAGNYTSIVRNLDLPRFQDACVSDNSTYVPDGPSDALFAIACSDAEDHSAFDIPFYGDYVKKLKNQSSTFGAYWSFIRFGCGGWQVRPKWRFTGPFTTPLADPGIKEGVPAAPLLFVSTRLDPVTPLVNANAMSAGHPGSAVLMQNSAGHCALLTQYSECTNQILRDYFEFGVVPKNGTVCETECQPWDEDCEPVAMMSSISATGLPLLRNEPLKPFL